jgi:hypothetical protein
VRCERAGEVEDDSGGASDRTKVELVVFTGKPQDVVLTHPMLMEGTMSALCVCVRLLCYLAHTGLASCCFANQQNRLLV